MPDEMRGQLVITYIGTVLDMERGEHLAVLSDHLGGKLVLGVLQLLERGDLRKDAHQQQQEEHQGERSRYQDPKPLDYLLFGNLFHQPEILS